MTSETAKASIGSSFDEFLNEKGLYEEVQEGALLRVLLGKFRRS